MLIARPKPGQPFSQGQPLLEHIKNVAREAAKFAEPFGCGNVTFAGGMLHDAGKAALSWQDYLRNAVETDLQSASNGMRKMPPPIKHAAAGSAIAMQHYGEAIGTVLAYLIAGHHAGLPDGDDSMLPDAAPGWSLSRWQKEGMLNLADVEAVADILLKSLPALSGADYPAFIFGSNDHASQAIPFWIRMLFSCLVDADYLDAEAVGNPDWHIRRGFHVSMADLLARLNEYLSRFPTPEPGTVNAVREEVQAACRTAAQKEGKVFSLTVPTGGGKTLSGMAFALEYAVKYQKRRVIYVIPYTSIIEQTADIFRAAFGPENVCEHHSDVEPRKNESDQPSPSRLAVENWDAPIVVTTSVQFFESLYASRGSRCRKLHNLADAVIILDEAQLVPVSLLDPCIEVLRQLVTGYGATVVLSTATQPVFRKLEATEIIPDPTFLFDRLRRTRFVWPKSADDTVSWPELADRLRAHESFLCIVNTRRDAYDLWQEVGLDAFHLSTMMCPHHRRAVLATIRERLASGEPVWVVSTQLVEAGVDIDFPIVYRAIAGMDSLVQAAGRCNREGRTKGLADVHVFIPEKQRQVGLITKGLDIVREFLRTRDPAALESPAIFSDYFARLYDVLNDTGSSILDDMARNARAGKFPFRTIASRFHLIDEDTVPIITNYDDGRKLIEQVRNGRLDRETMRQAQGYIVAPPRRIAQRLEQLGHIEEVADGLYVVTHGIGNYDEKTGLAVWHDDISPESLII